MIPVQVIKISYQTSDQKYFVILEEKGGERFLSIKIGSNEAQSIALAIKKDIINSPVNYDLICNLIKKTSGTLSKVCINKYSKGIYYSNIVISYGAKKNIILDSRPSDAIGIALKMNSTILVYEKLLIKRIESKKIRRIKKNKSKISLKSLNKKLNIAVQNEEYERAAILRDKIISLKI